MEYRIKISDRDLQAIDEVQGRANNITFEYDRNGGCGFFSLNVPARFLEELSLGLNYNVKIYRLNRSTKAYDLWYQGRIENKNYSIDGVKETVNIRGDGYRSQLSDIYVDRDYSGQTVEDIVTDILDNDVVPNTDISYSGGDIVATGVTLDDIEFNCDALKAFTTLAEIVGTREWGVDRNRAFFFKARSETVNFSYTYPGKIIRYNEDDTSKEIVNRVILIGGDVGGVTFTRVGNDTGSQLKWKRRDKPMQNAAIVTNAVADQFIAAQFAEFSQPSFRARLDLRDERLIENTTPLGLFEIIPTLATYGTRKYQTGLYSGRISLQINRVSYTIDGLNNLKTSIQIGRLRPDAAEAIGQLQYKLDQLTARGI